jgi:hypothetical protein
MNEKDRILELAGISLKEEMSFKDALSYSMKNKNKKDSKITYGTRSKKFHLIDKNDRDYNKFSIFPSEFIKFKTEKDAIKALTGSKFLK